MLVGASFDAAVGTVIRWQCSERATALPASSALPPPTATTMSASSLPACARSLDGPGRQVAFDDQRHCPHLAGGAQRLDARAQDGMHGAVDHQRGAAAEEGGLPAQGVQCVGALYVAAGSAEDRQHAVSYLRGAGGR